MHLEELREKLRILRNERGRLQEHLADLKARRRQDSEDVIPARDLNNKRHVLDLVNSRRQRRLSDAEVEKLVTLKPPPRIVALVDLTSDENPRSNSKANVYRCMSLDQKAQAEDVDMARAIQDMYPKNCRSFRAEAELSGDPVTHVTENNSATGNAEAHSVPEAEQSECQMHTHTEEYCMGDVTEDTAYAAHNGVYGEVYEVVEQTNGGEQLHYPEAYSTGDQNLYANVTEVCKNQTIDETGQLCTSEPTQEESYTEEQLTQYNEEQLTQYSEEQAAQYSEERQAEYSEEQVAHYFEEQPVQCSEQRLAQYSEEQLAEYTEEPAVDGQYAEYSEEHYARYAQVADEQWRDATADPSQYYAATNAQMEAGDYSEVHEVIEALSDQVVVGTRDYAEQQIEFDPRIQYDGTIYASEGYVDPAQYPLHGNEEVIVQESSETAASVDSAFYDETVGAPHNLQAEEQLIYETIEAVQQDAALHYYGAELDQGRYAVAEQDLVDGMTAMSLQSTAQGYQLDEITEVEYVTEYYGATFEEEDPVGFYRYCTLRERSQADCHERLTE